MGALWATLLLLTAIGSSTQSAAEAATTLQEADRLAWLRLWTQAEPHYVKAQRLFAAIGDDADALYAEIGAFRGRLPTMAVPAASERLAEYLDHPIVQANDRVRLRCLVIKAETDEDLDPALAEQSWIEALALAERMGESGWANRARGELGVVASLQGNISTAIIQLGKALAVAQSTGDASSVVRWQTLFGHGFVELGQPARALDFYDRALKAATTVPELRMPVMTYLGKGDALAKLGRLDEAENVLTSALKTASELDAAGYQAELSMKLAAIAQQRQQPARADRLLSEAEGFAKSAGGNRILAHVALDRGRLLRAENRLTVSGGVLETGIAAARSMQERLLLPKLLAELAEVRSSQRRYDQAASLLEEGSDLIEALLSRSSSPWVQGRIINGARDLFLARVRLEGRRGPDAARLYTIVEQARGRALLELLNATRVADVKQPTALRAQERRISALQLQLVQARTRTERQRLLDQIFTAEEQLAPLATAVFDRTRVAAVRKPATIRTLQRALQPQELFLGYALAEPHSYVLVVTPAAARVQVLPSRIELRGQVEPFEKGIRSGGSPPFEAAALSTALLGSIPELLKFPRLFVSPDGELHNLPFELLVNHGQRLLDTHVIAYVPSGSVLTTLRERRRPATSRVALAVSASPDGPAVPESTSAINRSSYDLDGAQLRPLPSANDEARAVAAALGASTTVLLGDSATEAAIKRLPLDEYGVVHFAVHGIPSTRFPARSALLLRPGDGDDGLLQAREILGLRLSANLVALSACDTGSGEVQEQEGVASLVRPFLAAGARAVVANAWAADDRFSLSLMREFYRQLAGGADVGEALRRAKLRMLELFGPEAVPRLWSGLLVYGDGAVKVGQTPETSKQ